MLFELKKINRIVDLNDELVNEYTKYEELHENPFFISIRAEFKHNPTKEEISDEELSNFCNEILLDELKAYALLPKAIQIIEKYYDEMMELSNKGHKFELDISEGK